MDQLANILKYLQGRLSSEDLNALDNWRNASSENQEFFDSISEIYISKEGKDEIRIFDTEEKWQEIEHLISEEKSNRSLFIKWSSIAASLLILAAAALWLFWPEPLYKEITSGTTSHQLTLPDNSVVTLGPKSKMKYFTRISRKIKERIIYLDGDARIEVTKNEKIPFVVISGKTGTRVLGTIFEISQPDSLHTIVSNIEGLIRFYELADEANSVIVNEGESFRYDGSSFTNITPVEPEIIPQAFIPPAKPARMPVREPVAEEPPVLEQKPAETPPPPKEEPPVIKVIYTSVEDIIDELSKRYAGKFNTAPWGQFRFNAKIPIDLTKYQDISLEDLLKELSGVAKVEYRQTCPDCYELVALMPK